MLIRITDDWRSLSHKIDVYTVGDLDMGIKLIDGSFGNTYKVFDKRLFFLAVIKYGIEYKYICESKDVDKQKQVSYYHHMEKEIYYATITIKVAVNKDSGECLTETVSRINQAIKKFDIDGEIKDYTIESGIDE